MRALELLGRFLDLGPWAVNLALSVGIFPYVLKLLQSSAKLVNVLKSTKAICECAITLLYFLKGTPTLVSIDLGQDPGHRPFVPDRPDQGLESQVLPLGAAGRAGGRRGVPHVGRVRPGMHRPQLSPGYVFARDFLMYFSILTYYCFEQGNKRPNSKI